MQIQSQQQALSFNAMYMQKGTFKVIKESSFFPKEAYANNPEALLSFYKRLKGLVKKSEENKVYNIVFKPEEQKVVIEDKEGREQSGFVTTFSELLSVSQQENFVQNPPLIDMLIKNLKKLNINFFQKIQDNGQIVLRSYLDVVYQRIQQIVKNADYLASIQK